LPSLIRHAGLAFLLPILSIFTCSAQTAPSSAAATTLQSTTTLVFVPARVALPSGELLYTLIASDFELTDNGVPQKFTFEANQAVDTRPLALVVLMQIGGAAQAQAKNFAHLDTMLAGIIQGPPDKIAIVGFDSRPEYDSPFTSNVADWSDALNHPDPGDGGAAIFDGVAYALDLLKQQPPDTRRAILLISQQHDSGSKTKVKDILREVGETNTAVYALTFSVEKAILKEGFSGFTHLTHNYAPMGGPIDGFDGQDYFDILAPVELAAGAMRKDVAAEVAGLSGGEPFAFSNKKQFDLAINTLGNHIRNGYLLTFRPTSNQPGLHTLKLRVPDHPELHIDARTSYWADPAKASE
jgi:VWFA-related protein